MPPFGFLKKKETPDKDPSAPSPTANSSAAPPETISLSDAQDLLKQFESSILQKLTAKLEPVRIAVQEAHETLSEVANEMEKEEIKFEDMEKRHRSVVENSRKTVISTLRREIATELSLPSSVNDVKKFRERMESMMKRFGEVSGSHSKLLNYFLKKHSSKMKREFEGLNSQLSMAKATISEFEQARLPVIRCTGLLNSAAQVGPGIGALEFSIAESTSNIDKIKEQIATLRDELDSIRATDDYSRARAALDRVNELEQKKSEIEKSVTDHFSHISRVLSKYSYGVDKETGTRLRAMTDEPSKVIADNVEPYVSLLASIRQSVRSGATQVKDSDKMVGYLDDVIRSLPDLRERLSRLEVELASLQKDKRNQVAHRANELEDILVQREEQFSRTMQLIDQQKKQLAQRKQEMEEILAEAETILGSLASKKYKITAPSS